MNINHGMRAVEEIMSEAVNSNVTILQEASHHILAAGGKRIRPRLALLSYAALGGEDINSVASVAAAVELVHTASVVHDDINDHGTVRRGRPSVNAIWGRTFALLTGDFLFTKVYELMAPFKDLNILLADATVALVEGETLQASAAKDGNLSREVYYDIIALKTAALFKAAGMLGAKLANGTEAEAQALGEYGFNIGLAFQIIDDILDLIGDSEQLGKTSGIDLAQGKGVGTVYATNGGSTTAVREDVALAEEDDNDPLASIKRKLLQGDAIQKAQMQAKMLAQQAINSLDVLRPSPAKDELIEMANQVVNRDH